MLNVSKNSVRRMLPILAMFSGSAAYAGATISIGEDKSVSVGLGFISSFYSQEKAAANGGRSKDFSLDSARIYLGGTLNKNIKGMLNTEKTSDDRAMIIDANVQFELTPEIAIWAGRFLSPSDRANMAGPYYSMGGGYWSNIASRYGWNGGIIGRDEGVALVANAFEGKVSYSFGVFDGDNIFKLSGINAQSESSAAAKTLKMGDNLMYAGRLQLDFWDAEPGYYGTGNYFGAKDILAIGLAGRHKSDGAISTTLKGDYYSYSADFLMEKKNIGPGTVSLEGAYYKYETDDVFLGEQGNAYSVGAAYLFNHKTGWGQFMPFVRYQKFDADGKTDATGVNILSSDYDTKRMEFGVNYVIEPYNTLISATYGNTDVTDQSAIDDFRVALQVQF